MDPFFSLVIPCCNIESYVEDCLQSVLKQTFRDWECIVYIETSSDRTEEIIRKNTADDPRFKILTGPKTGACSTARNRGVEAAEGEYIIFLDGDDAVADGCLERIHERICANSGADLYPCAMIARNEFNGKSELRDNYSPDAPAEMNGIEATLYLEKKWHGLLCPMLQISIYRKAFLRQNQLKCIPYLRQEDSEFSPRALYLAKRVVPIHELYYLYRIRPNSIMTSMTDEGCFLKDRAIITKSLLAFYDKVSQEKGFDTRVIPCWNRQWISRMNYWWFSPKAQKEIPREKRVEWLSFIFADGYDSWRSMIRYGSRPQRIAAFLVQMFVRHPSMRWIAELYFLLYFKVLLHRHARTKESLSTPIPG